MSIPQGQRATAIGAAIANAVRTHSTLFIAEGAPETAKPVPRSSIRTIDGVRKRRQKALVEPLLYAGWTM
jgi:hypothetical protein